MARASDNPFPSVLLVEGAAPTGPAAGRQRLFFDVADHQLKRVASDGTVTAVGAASGIQPTIVDAKGDLLGATAPDTPVRVPVGADGQVLTADAAQATGVRWATPAAGGGGATNLLLETFDSDPIAGGRYTYGVNGGNVTFTGGRLAADATVASNIVSVATLPADHIQVVKFRVTQGPVNITRRLAVFLRYASETSHLRAGLLQAATDTLQMYVGLADGTSLLLGPTATLSAGLTWDGWLAAWIAGRFLTVGFYPSDPLLAPAPTPQIWNQNTPMLWTLSAMLTDAQLNAHGVGNRVGLRVSGGTGLLADTHTVR